MDKPKILILGGTGEARRLASRAVDTFGDAVEIITSQAGVTSAPESVSGRLVTGGFGGIAGMQHFIEQEGIRLVVDATHAFAATISDNAYIACMATKTNRITLVRPGWEIPGEANVKNVTDMKGAADVLADIATRVLVTTGRRGLDALSHLEDLWFLVRLIEQPDGLLPLTRHQVLNDRPPYSLDQERALMVDHQIDALLTKQSGGDSTYAKIEAAVEAEIPIVLIRRPDLVPGDWTSSVDDCLVWLQSQL